jgi:hypothetical protein
MPTAILTFSIYVGNLCPQFSRPIVEEYFERERLRQV